MNITEKLIEFLNNNKGGELSTWIIDEFDSEVEIDEVQDEVVDERRWFNVHEVIYSIPSERTFLRVREGHGATEYQEHDGIYDVVQVYPQEKTVIEYVTKENIRAK